MSDRAAPFGARLPAATSAPLPTTGERAARSPLSIALLIAVVLALGVAVAIPEPLWLVLGSAAVLATLVTFIQPLAAVPLLLFAVPFGTLGRAGAGSTEAAGEAVTAAEPSIGAIELLVALLGAAWLAHGVRTRGLRVVFEPVSIALLAMVGLAALSLGWAEDRTSAIKEAVKWLELLLVVLVVVDLVRTRLAARWLIGAMLLAGAAEALYGAFQFATGAGPDEFAVQGSLRAFGHFDQPNPFAGYLTTMFPMAIMMVLMRSNPWQFRVFALGASGLLALGIGLSQSRGAWLGAVVSFAVLVLLWSRTTRRLVVPGLLLAVFAVCLAITGLLPPAMLDRIAQTVAYFGVFDVRTVEPTTENWAVVERMAHWQAGWYMFLDHPWIGIGAGNYGEAYSTYFIQGWPEALGHAHNYYLNTLAELGLIGGLLLVTVIVLAFRRLGGALLGSEDEPDSFWRGVLAGAVGGLAVFCVHNLFDSLFVHGVNVQIGVLLGLGLVAAAYLKPRPHGDPGMTTRTIPDDVDPVSAPAPPEPEIDERADSDADKSPSLGARFFNVRTLISFGIGFAVLAFLFTRVQLDVAGIFEWVRQANIFLLVLAALVFYATFPVRALRWRRMLDNVSYGYAEGSPAASTARKRVTIPLLTEIIFLGWFANCIVPAKLGDAYRAYLLKLNARVSFSTTIGTILAERIIDVIVLFVLMLASTWLSFGRALPPEVLLILQIGCGLVILTVLGLLAMRPLRPVVERLLPQRLHPQYERFEAGTLGSFRTMPPIVALTIVAWAGEVARLYLVTLALGLGGIAQSVIVFVALASALMTTLPLTPAGLGFAEGAIIGIFLLASRAGLAPGVDEHAAASIALLDRGISYWSLVAVGLVVYPLSKRK